MKGHVHDSTITALIVFAMVALVGLVWHGVRVYLVASDGETRAAIGKAMANFY